MIVVVFQTRIHKNVAVQHARLRLRSFKCLWHANYKRHASFTSSYETIYCDNVRRSQPVYRTYRIRTPRQRTCYSRWAPPDRQNSSLTNKNVVIRIEASPPLGRFGVVPEVLWTQRAMIINNRCRPSHSVYNSWNHRFVRHRCSYFCNWRTINYLWYDMIWSAAWRRSCSVDNSCMRSDRLWRQVEQEAVYAINVCTCCT